MAGKATNRHAGVGKSTEHRHGFSKRNGATSELRRTRPPPLQQENQTELQVQNEPLQSENYGNTRNEPDPISRESIGQHSSAGSCSSIKKVRGKYKCVNVDMKTKNGKLTIDIPDEILRAVGENARNIVNYCGFVVRSTAPLKAKNWSEVTKLVGEDMWLQVKEKFQIRDPIKNEWRFHGFILATCQRLYRGWKYRLHMIYKKFNTFDERMAAKPEDVSKADWKYLIEKFDSEAYQKASKRNAENRSKLQTKHACGTRSFAEVEELTKDPVTEEKLRADVIWLVQHTKKSKEGESIWSDPKSREIYEQLHELVVQNETQQIEERMNDDEMLLQVLGQKSGYFRGKGAGKQAPTKRSQENVTNEVEKSLRQFRETTYETMREELRERIKNDVRAEVIGEIREEVAAGIREEVTAGIREEVTLDLEGKFERMFADKMATLFGSFSHLRGANSSSSLNVYANQK